MATAVDVTDGVKRVLVKETDGKGYGVFAAKLFKEGNTLFYVFYCFRDLKKFTRLLYNPNRVK